VTWEVRASAVILGLLAGWYVIVDTGLASRGDLVAWALSVVILLVAVAVTWAVVRWSMHAGAE
jgi:hypothetical protein